MQHSNCQLSTVNCQLIAVADDITGAAEIAGIGLQFGLRVSLIMYMGDESVELSEPCDLLIFATDTRSMSELESVRETDRLCKLITEMGCTQIFKKTDSALRGHILVELTGLMRATGKKRALLLPQNPSKGRIISDGRYYINSVPLHETPFAHDPEFPAKSANVSELCYGARMLLPEKRIKRNGIYIAEAATQEEVMQQVAKLDENVLPAGGADFFTSYLLSRGYVPKDKPMFNGLGNNSALIVLGSTARHPIMDFPYIRRRATPVHNTPRLLFFREAPKQWVGKIDKAYASHHSLIIYTNHPPMKGREFAVNLREHVGKVVQSLLSEHQPQELIIEGGATAFSILKRLGWKVFCIQCEVAPGVIRMTPTGKPETTVTLKPGSYPWGELFK
ncbi:four-carbon acid sugar kinase family protein [Bacteroides sp. 51]|uniref:four-carbon acid sugar kinase family protein n=1 Tax=Bacteroides sp. 51 TaxID=2302938 RepID=UPI0013D3BB15|nr:four-carbon acid sugar kinase family protein [Bacteroides sp. 51]NDV80388.1 four-carbon acid sugar kinase family protein [Bacteroides sp. 51]